MQTINKGDIVKIVGQTWYSGISANPGEKRSNIKPYENTGIVTKVGNGFIWVRMYEKAWKFTMQSNGKYGKSQGSCPHWELEVDSVIFGQ